MRILSPRQQSEFYLVPFGRPIHLMLQYLYIIMMINIGTIATQHHLADASEAAQLPCILETADYFL